MSSRCSGASVFEGSTILRPCGTGISLATVGAPIASPHSPGVRISACIQRWVRARPGSTRLLSGGMRFGGSFAVAFRLQSFGMHDLESRDRLVPFQQCRDSAYALVDAAVKLPDMVDHVIAVRIEDMRA